MIITNSFSFNDIEIILIRLSINSNSLLYSFFLNMSVTLVNKIKDNLLDKCIFFIIVYIQFGVIKKEKGIDSRIRLIAFLSLIS